MVDLRTMSIKTIIHALIDATMEDRIKWGYNEYYRHFVTSIHDEEVIVRKFSIELKLCVGQQRIDSSCVIPTYITKRYFFLVPFSEERNTFKELRYFIKLQYTNGKRKQSTILEAKTQEALLRLNDVLFTTITQ